MLTVSFNVLSYFTICLIKRSNDVNNCVFDHNSYNITIMTLNLSKAVFSSEQLLNSIFVIGDIGLVYIGYSFLLRPADQLKFTIRIGIKEEAITPTTKSNSSFV